jgi:hypothetical protein
VILTDKSLIMKNDVNGDIRDVLSLVDITHAKIMAEDAAFRHGASLARCLWTVPFPLACSACDVMAHKNMPVRKHTRTHEHTHTYSHARTRTPAGAAQYAKKAKQPKSQASSPSSAAPSDGAPGRTRFEMHVRACVLCVCLLHLLAAQVFTCV